MDFFFILLATVFVNNYVLVKFLGLCPFMGVSKKPQTAIGMGMATSFVLTLTSAVSYALHNFVLVPLELEFLQTILFIVTIASVVGFCELFMRKTNPILHQMLGMYLPLITSNCAVLGVALLNVRIANSLLESAVYGFGAAIGFTLVLVIFSTLRERLNGANIPQAFQGAPIALITAGFMAVAFMGFGGIGLNFSNF